MPKATAAALPPLEPPAVRERSHGLRVVPCKGLSVTAFHPISGVVVLPNKTAPLSRSNRVEGASSVQGWSGSTVCEPRSVGHPRVRKTSLIATGSARLRNRCFGVQVAVGVDTRVVLFDLRQDRRGDLDRRELVVAEGSYAIACAKSGQLQTRDGIASHVVT
jgi:hypothetical protein